MMMAAASIGTTMTHHGNGADGWGLFRTTRAAGITEIWAYVQLSIALINTVTSYMNCKIAVWLLTLALLWLESSLDCIKSPSTILIKATGVMV